MSIKKILVFCWNKAVDDYLKIRDSLYRLKDIVFSHLYIPPKVRTIDDTIAYIINNRCSVSRFGDGEIKIIAGKVLGFQRYSPILQQKMKTVLSNPIENHIVCLPDIFSCLSVYEDDVICHWRKHLSYYRKYWYRYTDNSRVYYNAFISRCYMMYSDKSIAEHHFNMLKKIWEGREVLLIEGEQSRLGVGNDLFDNVSSIKRMLAPNMDAFDFYDRIMKKTLTYNPSSYLVLLALGPTATVLAYDLSLKGYQAVDIGHVDVEYEWFRMGVTHKVPVPNKFVNEAGAGAGVGEEHDLKYQKEIVCRF